MRYNDPQSYADGRVDTIRVLHAGRVKSDDPDKMYRNSPGRGLDVRPTTSPVKKNLRRANHEDVSDGTDEYNTIWL